MEAFGEFIPRTLLGRSQEKVNSRQRIFSPLFTFWAFLADRGFYSYLDIAQLLGRGVDCVIRLHRGRGKQRRV
jgi:hypothetical protein